MEALTWHIHGALAALLVCGLAAPAAASPPQAAPDGGLIGAAIGAIPGRGHTRPAAGGRLPTVTPRVKAVSLAVSF